MKSTRSLVTALLLAALLGAASAADAALLQRQGKVTFLRVHDVGTGFGPPGDQIDVEVVFQLDTQPLKSFGFQVRNDANRAARQGMLDLLRDAFNRGWTVIVDFNIDDPVNDNNGVAIRVALTGNQSAPMAHQYAAKFVCGKNDEGKVVAPGEYFTAINVHNPGRETATIRKRFAVALPSEKPGPVSGVVTERLRPGEAFEIDCPDIAYPRAGERFRQGVRHHRVAAGPRGRRRLHGSQTVESRGGERGARAGAGAARRTGPPRPSPGAGSRGPLLPRRERPHGGDGTQPGHRRRGGHGHRDRLPAGDPRERADAGAGRRRRGRRVVRHPAGFLSGEGNHPFRITADKAATEAESNETNNVVAGNCQIIL